LLAILTADRQRQRLSGSTGHGLAQLPHLSTAAEICEGVGETGKASQFRGLFENVMRTLVQNLTAADRSRSSLLRALQASRMATGPELASPDHHLKSLS
jgi:hypothetical protein